MARAKRDVDGIGLREMTYNSIVGIDDNKQITFAVNVDDIAESVAKSFMLRCFSYKETKYGSYTLAVASVPSKYLKRFMDIFPEIKVYDADGLE